MCWILQTLLLCLKSKRVISEKSRTVLFFPWVLYLKIHISSIFSKVFTSRSLDEPSKLDIHISKWAISTTEIVLVKIYSTYTFDSSLSSFGTKYAILSLQALQIYQNSALFSNENDCIDEEQWFYLGYTFEFYGIWV